MLPEVYNRHHKNVPANAVYVGRGTPYGNPFVIGTDGEREEVIEKFRAYLLGNAKLVALVKTNLKGKPLTCSCWPKACHADVLIEVANSD